MSHRISRFLITLSLVLAWIAGLWVVIDVLFAEQDTLVGDSIAIGCALLAPIVCVIGWGIRWAGERRPLARA